MRCRICILTALVILLSACSTLPEGPQTAVNLPAQLQQLATITEWQIKGKMALRNNNEAVSAHINWKTNQPDFHFRLTNLLGITLANVNYQNGMAVLEADDNQFKDTSPDEVIYQATGWTIPVVKLLSWVKGLPLEGDNYQLNDKHLLAALQPGCQQCAEWQVSYANYGEVNGLWLPHQLTLRQTQNSQIMIKIRIDEWILQ